jgi:hypothetical protein
MLIFINVFKHIKFEFWELYELILFKNWESNVLDCLQQPSLKIQTHLKFGWRYRQKVLYLFLVFSNYKT